VRFGEVRMIGFFRLTPNRQHMGVKNLVAIRCPAGSQKPSNLPGDTSTVSYRRSWALFGERRDKIRG
jgi:hypothetical protein